MDSVELEKNQNGEQILINEQFVTREELENIKKDRNKRLVEVSPNKFRLLERLYS